MKAIINLVAIIWLLLSSSTFANSSVELYSSPLGDVSISSSEHEYSLLAIAGGQPSGASTAGDCMITAAIKRKNDRFVGWLVPLKTRNFSYSESMAEKKSIELSFDNDSILINDANTLGICGFGVTFVEIYHKLPDESNQYKTNYIKFLKIIHEIAKNKFIEGDRHGAIKSMMPYAENYPMEWLGEANSDQNPIVFLNDYAFFLQQTGHSSDAINTLKKILKVRPKRTVAWLNLADAYWDIKEYSLARESYKNYILMMQAAKKSIPYRVVERVNAETK